MTDFSLKDRVAVVTGASRGIGEAIARGMAAQGATVVLVSRDSVALERVADSIRGEGGTAHAQACHAARPEAIAELFQWIDAELGRVDILVNNAATNVFMGPVLDTPEAAFDKTFALNVKGYMLMSQAAGRRMASQGKGSIVNIASVAGLNAMPFQGVYSMTKAAVIMMTKVFAKELGPSGVRCNVICPGLTETRFASALFENEEIYRGVIQATPLHRHAQPSEMVGAALYLASDAASYTTGAVIVVDGGMLA
jgi:NAD(P)-dependent dehydrogenase (short-subunit alcohol dehydrogenase family)